jgi:uncharacterized protein (TIGR02271 family)
MAHTVIGLFDSIEEAQDAVQALVNQGFNRSNIDISANNATGATSTNTTSTTQDTGDSVSNFFSSLFGTDNDDYSSYSEVARSGSAIVTVHAQSEQEASTAARLLDQYDAIDVNARAQQFRSGTTDTAATAATTTNTTATTAARADADASIPVIEEHLQVGKRVVETGGARLRSRIVERPVEETVRLRQEHLHVERTPVNRPATEADFNNFREGEIEMREQAEVPVVGKEARVVEEVSIGKEVEERNETVSGTVRKTDVEVEEINAETDVDRQTRTARP